MLNLNNVYFTTQKNIKFLNLEVNVNKFDFIFIQLCTFVFLNLQKITFTNLSYITSKKLDIVDMLLKLSLAVCFSKKKLKKTKIKKILLPHTNVFTYQTEVLIYYMMQLQDKEDVNICL